MKASAVEALALLKPRRQGEAAGSASVRLLLARSEVAVPVGGGHPSVHQDVADGDEPTVRAAEEGAHGAHLVGSARAARRGRLDHATLTSYPAFPRISAAALAFS